MEYSLDRRTKPGITELLMIISVSLMPYTILKVVGPLGPSEFLMMIVFIHELRQNNGKVIIGETFISKLFGRYLLIAFVGSVINVAQSFISGHELSAGFSSIMFDMLSYLFILMTIIAFEMHERDDNKACDAECILKYVVLFNCVTMPILYGLSRVRGTLFGMRLLYYRFFTPLATNLHHTSMYLLPLSFATIYMGERSHRRLYQFASWLFSFFFMFLAIQTGSTKAGLGVGLGIIISAFYKINTSHGRINQNAKKIFWLFVFIAVGFFLRYHRAIIQYAIDFFIENDVANGRQNIWSIALEKWKGSPIVGFGFGSHVKLGENFWDAHNTLITVMLQAGVIGLFVYLALWWKIVKHSIFNGYLFATNAAIFIYVAGGDVLRRIPCWSFIILSFLVIEKNRYQEVMNNELGEQR